MTGAWSLTATYAGGSLSCTVQGQLILDGSGSSLSGSLAEEQAGCTDNGTPIALTPDTLNVIATIAGRTLSFTPQAPEGEAPCAVLNFEGAVSGDQISGTVRTTPVLCQGTYVAMSGTWQAQRS